MSNASESVEYRGSYVDRISLAQAVVAGLVGGVFFGFVIQFGVERMAVIGALYNWGEPSLAIGWVAHMVHSALFGLVFGLVTEQEPFHTWMRRGYHTAVLVGLVFALGLYAFNIGVVWPTWLSAVGFVPAFGLPVPFFPVEPLLGHLAYGFILGAVFHLLVDY